MANNKVQLADGTTLMDLTDTTAEAADVAEGKYFYTAAGVKTLGTSSGSSGGAQSDWEEDDSTSAAYVENRPAIRAGTGENSIVSGMIANGDTFASYTIYITGDAKATEFSYTTQDDLTSFSTTYGIYFCSSATAGYSYGRVYEIDKTNNTICFYHSLFSTAITEAEVILYNDFSNMAIGKSSQALGSRSVAAQNYAHAEGLNSIATMQSAHAEGDRCMAHGIGSHAEGSRTFVSGLYAHAEGLSTRVDASYAHAEGTNTIASSKGQHVQGKFNIEDTNSTYADIVGNGTSDSARSNAYTLDWSGNGVYSGKVTVGTAPTADMDVATKKYVDDSISGVSDSDTTYTLSISSNVITLTPSSGSAQSITLPVYDGSVS